MIRNTNIRFYEEEEEDKRAWEILHALDKKQFKSQSKFVVLAILDYYEKCIRQEQDPYFETREKEEAFSDRIVKSVEEKVLSNLPALIGNYVMCMQQISFQNGVTMGQLAGVNSTGIFPTTTSTGAINTSEVVVKSDSDDLSKESDYEIEENEFLDFGMME
ncbi:hypothetical protein KHM83_18910 [Fusibacter paucivorans]|uniref:Uncharacterized protein n=1 Tax=Fusibacter paucivorans TaxID=76009 RepID=A0ABS5PV06_9FIRM|nr:hypothetical protein [Fusibacter paucivorans]MBS7528742.1 hypothetical protein [Fusibacter paucivorans]